MAEIGEAMNEADSVTIHPAVVCRVCGRGFSELHPAFIGLVHGGCWQWLARRSAATTERRLIGHEPPRPAAHRASRAGRQPACASADRMMPSVARASAGRRLDGERRAA